MERLDVVARAAARVRARYVPRSASANGRIVPAVELTARLCDALVLELQEAPGSGVMLGGAYSRLQLWAWDQPELGGIIWLRDDLDAETRAFAIAHELGHYTLHRGEGLALRPACDEHAVDQRADASDLRTEGRRVEEYTPRAQRELEANAFAAELLAPRAEVRRLFTHERAMDATRLATHCGISRTLAQRRLVDAVLVSRLAPDTDHDAPQFRQYPNEGDAPETSATAEALDALDALEHLDSLQREAACAAGPALVIAGPGSGKTATLVGRAAYLVCQRDLPPERLLALTFSNRAAAEMRERLVASGLPGERMHVMTTHAFAAELLREYASRAPHAADEPELRPDFRILDEANAFLLMEELLATLPLRHYRSLGNPTAHLRALLADFSHARDALLTPADYLALVEAMPLAPEPQAAADAAESSRGKGGKGGKTKPPAGLYTAEEIAKARERAESYRVWDRALRQRGLVDFGGLIQRAVELLEAAPEVVDEVRGRFPQLLVDEFQDTNYAAAELLMRIAGASGKGLWVVGDRNQSIYRFRGASPGNLFRLIERYPDLHVCTLRRCYRSVPAIVRLGSTIAAHMARLAPVARAGTHRASAQLEKNEQGDALDALDAPGALGGAVTEATRPQELEPVRPVGAHAAILRGETFTSATHEYVGLAAAIERQRARGVAYGDQAILCRTHKQAHQIAAVLAALEVPIDQVGDFFALPEVKDTLALIAIAAGPDARGLLRGGSLLSGLGYPPPLDGELAATARALARARRALPGALTQLDAVDGTVSLTGTTRDGLRALGANAVSLRYGSSITEGLCVFLLRPGGYVWRLARVADGLDTPAPLHDAGETGSLAERQPGAASGGRARSALAALGEFLRLTARFDQQWSQDADFRERLILAVTHRRVKRSAATSVAVADAEQPAPAADAIPTTALTERGATQDAELSAPAVRCFLHYLNALRASANLATTAPAGDENAVHVLTLHQSKGLEFPVIYLPGLAQGRFPPGVTRRADACPPGFRESDAPGEREAEERSLFYVGVTRARDTVVFTRALTYGKGAQPSTLLALLEGAADGPGESPDSESMLPEEEVEHLLAIAATLTQEEDSDDERDDDADEARESDNEAARGADDRPARPTFHLRELEQYLTCPLQYKYAQRYGLLDPAKDAVNRFHRYIRKGARELHDLRTSAPDCDWPTAVAQLQALWQTDGPAGHAYDAFYWQRAEEILRAEWATLTSSSETAPLSVALLAQPLLATLRRCMVEVTADRVVSAPAAQTGGRSAPPLTLLVRLHTGRPREADTKDLTLPLYYLAHQQGQPATQVSIALSYVGDALSNDEPEQAHTARNELVDVTEIARKAAEKYSDPRRKQRSALDKLDEAADGIMAGRFAPRPEEQRCASCAYCHVCPADPDSADASAASKTPTYAQASTSGAQAPR